MRTLSSITALGLLCFLALLLNAADAHIYGPSPYGGHTDAQHCDAVTHLSYYDPRNQGVTAYNSDQVQGDDVYYVDTNPQAGFDGNPDLGYQSTQTSDQDCEGTPVLRATAYLTVTVTDLNGTPTSVGYPPCPGPAERNPDCQDKVTGAHVAAYVATPDQSHQIGGSLGVTDPLVDP